jgi:dihydroxyacid dehydratase/phosphogluconate dehydratase
VVVNVLGGSTNAVLHLLACARSANVPLTIDDFQVISERTPYLGDMKPSGRYLQEDFHKVGGIPALVRYLITKGLIDGSALTVTGRTLGENVADAPVLDFEKQDVIRPVERPIKKSGHITILRGNLAPNGAVAKLTGKEGLYFEVRKRGYIHVREREKETELCLFWVERERLAASTLKTTFTPHSRMVRSRLVTWLYSVTKDPEELPGCPR